MAVHWQQPSALEDVEEGASSLGVFWELEDQVLALSLQQEGEFLQQQEE